MKAPEESVSIFMASTMQCHGSQTLYNDMLRYSAPASSLNKDSCKCHLSKHVSVRYRYEKLSPVSLRSLSKNKTATENAVLDIVCFRLILNFEYMWRLKAVIRVQKWSLTGSAPSNSFTEQSSSTLGVTGCSDSRFSMQRVSLCIHAAAHNQPNNL